MCGIAGALDLDRQIGAAEMRRRMRAMIAPIDHRGPDANGVLALPPAGLGHRRLAIIDLHARADQPMADGERENWVVFNGEIYNFRELRLELEARGRRFRTDSDTEVLLAGWKEWGESLFEKLAGMFALAIWDQRQGLLVLARDRFGKKPLFVAEQGKTILFASEIKSILNWKGFVREPNYAAIHDYLTFNYCIGTNSAFRGIERVAAGGISIYGLNGSVRRKKFWHPAEVDMSRAGSSVDALCEEFHHYFDQAIKRRLVSDVPVGAFLSGGVDSSAVVARMAPLVPHGLKTFSVGFREEGYDETVYARQVSDRFGTEHHEFTMGPELLGDLARIIWHYGEPYADSSALATFALSREIRKHVKVALTGDGGDEIFLGYQRYVNFSEDLRVGETGRRYLASQGGPLCSSALKRDLYTRSLASFRDREKLMGYGPAMLEHLSTSSHDMLGPGLESAVPETAIDLASRVDIATYLEGDLNVKADVATMAASLEGRAPFLDHDLADWALSLPQHLRVFQRNGRLETKALLKKALERHLPDEILYRKKKGFSVPVRHWLRNELHDFAYETLTSARFLSRGLFTRRYIDELFTRHREKLQDQGTRLWGLLSLELWFQTYIDRKANSPIDLPLRFRRPRG